MSIYLKAERDRLLAGIQAMRSTGEIAPAGCWIDSYLAKNPQGKRYEYYKLVATKPIFAGARGGITRTRHLGKLGSELYQTATLAIRRRSAIEQVEAQIARVEQLIDLDQNLPSAEDFSDVRVDS